MTAPVCLQKRRLGKWLIRAALCIVLPQAAFAGAWTMPKGEGQAITTISLHESSADLDDRGFPVGGDYSRIEVSPYVEYGLTQRITIGLQPRYQWAQSGAGISKSSSSGFGDADAFVRHKLWDVGRWVSSVQVGYVSPHAYDVGRMPAPGTGEPAIEARLLAGRSLSRGGWSYLNLEAGYRLGQGGVADQARFDAALGLRPWRRWLFLQEVSVAHSLENGDGAPGHAYDVIKTQSSIVYFLKDSLALQAGLGRDLSGLGVGLGSTGFLGIWIRF